MNDDNADSETALALCYAEALATRDVAHVSLPGKVDAEVVPGSARWWGVTIDRVLPVPDTAAISTRA